MCRALEGEGADRNLPILEARPFCGVGGQFLDRLSSGTSVSTSTCSGLSAVRQRPRPRPMICCSSSTVIRRRNASAMLSG